MRNVLAQWLVLMMAASAVYAGTPVEIQVRDDAGGAIPNVELALSHQPPPTKFVSLWQGGAYSPKRERIVVKTGKDGVARGQFPSDFSPFHGSDGRLLVNIMSEVVGDEYYQPFPVFEAIPATTPTGKGVAKASCVMRRKISPHAMNDGWGRAFYSVRPETDMRERLKLPRLPESFFIKGTEMGFDLVKGSWMPPEGKGEHTDLLVSVEIEGPAGLSRKQLGEFLTQRSHAPSLKNPPPELKLTYRFQFQGAENGVVAIPMEWPPVPEDCLMLPLGGRIPQVAPESGYVTEVTEAIILSPRINEKPIMNYEYGAIECWDYQIKAIPGSTPGKFAERKQVSLFFRIRRGEDDDKTAYYGVIRGGFRLRQNGLVFNYCINPLSGERNVEQHGGVRADENARLYLTPNGIDFKSKVVDWLKPYCAY